MPVGSSVIGLNVNPPCAAVVVGDLRAAEGFRPVVPVGCRQADRVVRHPAAADSPDGQDFLAVQLRDCQFVLALRPP